MPPKRKAESEDTERTRKDAIRQQVTERIRDLDEAHARQYIEKLAREWQLEYPSLSYEQIVATSFANFGLSVADDTLDISDTGSFGLRALDDAIDEREMEAIGMYHRLRELKLLDNDPELLSKIVRIIEAVYYARKIVLSSFQAKLSLFASTAEGVTLDPSLDERLGSWSLRFRWVDMDQTNQIQRLLIHLLDVAMEKRYRKQGGMVFEPIYVDSKNSHAWKQVMDIKSFIYANASKELHFDQWLNLTNGHANVKTAVDYLTNANDYQFPHLVKDRTVFAFRNGLYLARQDSFVSFESMPDSVVACKFFDVEFDTEYASRASWRDIPTPHFQGILDHQQFPSDVCRWMHILIGRLVFPLNELDGWQVIPFMNGLAGCFAAGTTVVLANGTLKCVEDVVVGDALIGDDGASARTVTSLGRGTEAMFRVTMIDDGESYVVNASHILCLAYADQNGVFAAGGARAWELRTYDDGTFRKLSFETKDDAEQAARRLSTTTTIVEISVRDYLALPAWAKMGLRGYRVAIDAFPNALQIPAPVDPAYSYGLELTSSSRARSIPVEYRTGSRATRMAVLWGVLDASGDVFSHECPVIVNDVAFIARSLGFRVIRGEKSCVILDDKGEGEQHTAAPPKMRMSHIAVESVGEGKYYGFSVDGNNRFLLGDFTATHNSGKSTIVLRVCKAMYEAIDVGVLSNNVERKFGISAFYDKLMFVAPEIKSDLAIEQAEFQSIVSGEDVQVNVKFCKAFSTTWRVPGVLAGNEVPSWADNSGSIQRRILVFDFCKPVLHGDMKLGDKLELEMPRILVKCVRAYREAAAAWGTQNVWSVLPSYFKRTRDELAASVNSFEAFIASDEVVLGPDKYCPLMDVKHALKAFEMSNGFKSAKMTAEFWRGPFAKHNFDKRIETLEYRGKRLKREYVFGMDIADRETVEGNALG